MLKKERSSWSEDPLEGRNLRVTSYPQRDKKELVQRTGERGYVREKNHAWKEG